MDHHFLQLNRAGNGPLGETPTHFGWRNGIASSSMRCADSNPRKPLSMRNPEVGKRRAIPTEVIRPLDELFVLKSE